MFRHLLDADSELRLLEERHAEELYALVDTNRTRLREWLPWLDHNRTPDASRAFIRSSLEAFAANKGFTAGIWHGGRLAGVCGYHAIDWGNKAVSLGYWIGVDFEGKGLMSASVKALLAHAFGTLNLNRVEIRAAMGNSRSQKIPRTLGFREEGVARQAEWLYDRYVDLVVFSMLKSEWKRA